MNELKDTIFSHPMELKVLIGYVVAVTLAYAELRWKLVKLGKDHQSLKKGVETLDETKANVAVCRVIHGEQKQTLNVVLDTIKQGNKDIREDIKHITDRLDAHIQATTGK